MQEKELFFTNNINSLLLIPYFFFLKEGEKI